MMSAKPDNDHVEAETAFDLNFVIENQRVGGQRFFLDGPWYAPLEITGNTLFGREADLPPEIRSSLETRYDNVSRRHAEFRLDQGGIWIIDLESSNGTFVDEVRLPPKAPVRLVQGARIRFAADLEVVLRIECGNV
jgi:hypothetical protein